MSNRHHRRTNIPTCVSGRSQQLGWLVVIAVSIQVLVLYKATIIHGQDLPNVSDLWQTPLAETTIDHPTVPRVLIGIMGHLNNHKGRVSRWRHRTLFGLWNDTRMCTLAEYERSRSISCQIIYTFVIAGHNASATSVPTFLVDDSRPLVLQNIPLMPRYKDANDDDVTVLNIQENMNDGKTPTFVYWASETAKRLGIPYFAKCDDDAMVRPNALFQLMHMDLPWGSSMDQRNTGAVPPTIVGSFRHKTTWNQTANETFWQAEYRGTHLYFAGQLYMMSVDVADYLLQAFRMNRTDYFEGHEDHDAASMIEMASPHIPIRWISMSRHNRFWEHPVKGEYWWNRILRREQKKKAAGKLVRRNFTLPQGSRHRKSLLVILGATTAELQVTYRNHLKAQSKQGGACPVTLDPLPQDEKCEVYYVFAVGGNDQGPTEKLRNADDLLLSTDVESSKPTTDVWVLNIANNIHRGMATSVLFFIEQRVAQYQERFNFVVFVQSNYGFDISKWLAVEQTQSSPHHMVIGDIRDKDQRPHEFPPRNETYWYHEYDQIHLYLGSECLAFSSTLLPGLVNESRSNPEPRKYYVGNIGHDLTTVAYYIPKTILQWVPITKTLRFWSRMGHSRG